MPDGELVGRIVRPEQWASVRYGGAQRNRMHMAGSKSLCSLLWRLLVPKSLSSQSRLSVNLLLNDVAQTPILTGCTRATARQIKTVLRFHS